MTDRWNAGHLAGIVWLISMVSVYWFPPAMLLVVATTFNLWHARRTHYNAGQAFEDRVNGVLAGHISEFMERIEAMEKDVQDIKESQVKIAGSFRGRQLPQ